MRAVLALLIFSSALILSRADPDGAERGRRAPATSVPTTWGTKVIQGSTIPFGQWEHSTQCHHIDHLQSHMTLPWGEHEHIPQGSSLTIDVVARDGSKSIYPRDSNSFYVWADGKMLEMSQGSEPCTASPDDYDTCLDDANVSKLVSVPIPQNTKTIAILPVNGKCQQTAFRIKIQRPGVCGTDAYRVPLDLIGNGPVHVEASGAVAACGAIGSHLVHATWKNIEAIADVGFDCSGPDSHSWVASWNADSFDGPAVQVSHKKNKQLMPDIKRPDSNAHAPICSGTRQTVYGQELASNIRVVHVPQGFVRDHAPSICQANGYSLADLVTTTAEGRVEIQDALTELYLADGELGIGWVRSVDNDQFFHKCVGYGLDPAAHLESDELAGHVVEEPCDSTKLTAVICQKPDDRKLSDVFRQQETY